MIPSARGRSVLLFVLMGLCRMIALTGSVVIPARRVVMIPSARGRSVLLFVLMGLCLMTALTGSVVKSRRNVMMSQTPSVLGGSAAVPSVRKRETLIALGGSADPLMINIVLKRMSNVRIGKGSVVNHA